MVEMICLIKLHVWEQFLAPIIVDTSVIVFYKDTCNTRLAFNLTVIKCIDPFYTKILVFLYAII